MGVCVVCACVVQAVNTDVGAAFCQMDSESPAKSPTFTVGDAGAFGGREAAGDAKGEELDDDGTVETCT